MAQMMRQIDWSKTSLGPPETWPQALKVALRLLLTSRFEMWLGWGPDINFFYNDAYRPTLGKKHPNALAVPTKVLWAEIWDDVKDRLATVYETGQATWDRALLLLLERDGYPEETYHTFSYSPLVGDSGRVEGVFCAVTEETERVISERRMGTMRQLASALAVADRADDVCLAASKVMAENTLDLTFSLLYIFNDDGSAERIWANGISRDHPLAPAGLTNDSAVWDLRSIWNSQSPELVDIGDFSEVPTGAWHRPAMQAAIIPLVGQGGDKPKGVLITGLNPHRPINDDYLDFLKLVAGQIASRLASAEAFDTERRRATALAEAAQMREDAAVTLEKLNRQLVSEVELRTAERDRLRALFQQAPSFMCILRGPDHVFELVNDAYLQLVGHRELIGLGVRDALPEVAGQGFFELLDGVFHSGQAYVGRNMPVLLKRMDKEQPEERFINLIYQPIFDQANTVAGIFVDGFDVTDQKRAEDKLQSLNHTLEQRVDQRTEELRTALLQLERESIDREAAQIALRQAQKMEALGNLTGGVAHDFNNLLQVVSGNLQLLSKDVAGNARAELKVQNALAGVSRGSKLASQLLAFGRRQPLEPKVVNVRKLIQNMDDMLRRALGEEIELEIVISGGLWNTLIDASQLENAILNLAINGRDAMEGHGRLTIETANAVLDEDYARTHDDVRPGQYVLVAVTDTGSGIPPEILEHVLEPFFSTKSQGKGSGLGLSMVYGFLKQSGGHLKIYSEVGHGTTMKIYMPRTVHAEDTLADMNMAPAEGGTETVLVVEDDDAVRETSVALLSDLGYRVLKARDAQSAFTIIDSGVHVDLLFTDVVMPGPMRSTELARKAKALFPGMAILFTSGYTENSIVHGGRLDAGVELLSKPYTRDALARKVRHVLGNAAQHKIAADRLESQEIKQAQSQLATLPVRILVVEDEPLILMSTVDMLTHLGHSVQEAGSAEEALRILEKETVDILLTDVGLPGMSGSDLARQVRDRWPDVRIVFASGGDTGRTESGVGNALQLSKPFRTEDLAEIIAKAIAVV
ncbi:response regulator [Agrobacterium sp. rho-13.3]|uniref:hybrid sensor histidine kinase/response regulator n=1 Tax=Agrobacterium sp. rho-13.3 TaxID=3072980 RepID=UPI002A1810C5|nr:response regulator [Agrobacterium sp. rho-13.3]MDX8306802.1 response regulator [Agrobacterium sp. rho-13.3]MDX8306867.1 response regulator [Agrobacterium sp. rho-13.3]